MASFEDARSGWEIYRSFDFTLSLDELNDRLKGQGHAPIAPRTFRHYEKLRRYGFDHYLPINQLDVKTLQNPVWDAASRNRYPVIRARVPLEMRFPVGKDFDSFRGEAVQISEGILGARLRTKKAFNFFSVRSNWANRILQVVFLDSGEIVLASVDAVTLDETTHVVNVRIAFSELTSIDSLIDREALSPSSAQIIVSPGDRDIALSSVVEDLWWLFQALETCRVICQEALLALDSENKYVFPITRIRKLRVESPLEGLFDGAIPQLALLYWAVKGILTLQGTYWTNQLLREQALKARDENRRQDMRVSLDVERILDAVRRLVHDVLVQQGGDVSKKSFDDERVRSLVEKQLQTAVEGLGRGGAQVELKIDKAALAIAKALESEMQAEVDGKTKDLEGGAA